MNKLGPEDLQQYYRDAESWSLDRDRAARRSQRTAWLVAAAAGTIALVEGFALFALVPLKREVPYTLLVDRQTGYVEALKPLEASLIAPDAALTRSLLVQYVIARESFDIDSLATDYRKVGLWSAGEARNRYIAQMQPNSPLNPAAVLPRRAIVQVTVRSISSLSPKSALVRFSTVRTDPGGQPQEAQHWASVISYGFSTAEMSAADRLDNPLGFQVTRYRRDAETLPEVIPAASLARPANPGQAAQVPAQVQAQVPR